MIFCKIVKNHSKKTKRAYTNCKEERTFKHQAFFVFFLKLSIEFPFTVNKIHSQNNFWHVDRIFKNSALISWSVTFLFQFMYPVVTSESWAILHITTLKCQRNFIYRGIFHITNMDKPGIFAQPSHEMFWFKSTYIPTTYLKH